MTIKEQSSTLHSHAVQYDAKTLFMAHRKNISLKLPASKVLVVLHAIITILISYIIVSLNLDVNLLQVLVPIVLITALVYPRWVYGSMVIISLVFSLWVLSVAALQVQSSVVTATVIGFLLFTTSEALNQIMQRMLRVNADQRATDARYRLLAENVSDVIWLLSPEGEIDYVSHSVKKLLGYTPDELIALRRIVHTDESWERWKVAFRQLRNRTVQTPYYIELEWIKHDKTTVWTESTVDHLRDENGEIIGILGITRNIEERRALEEQALAMTLEQERMRILSSFITKASHEFRTPLSIINARAHMMTKIDDGVKREKHADIIEGCA